MADDLPTPPPRPSPSAGVPARRPLDRAALDRVLARAAELQAHETEPGEVALTEDQVLDVAREAGLSAQHVRQALAEERSRITVPEESGLAGRIAGPAVATAARTITGRPEQVLAALSTWMEREECLQVKRRFPDRTTWEAKRGLVGSIQRGLDLSGRGFVLARAGEVAATVVPVDDTRVLVRLDADLSTSRKGHLAGGGAIAAGGIAAGAASVGIASVLPEATTALYVISSAVAAASSLVGALGGYGVARRHLRAVAKVQLALEQILDRLERGDGPRSGFPAMLSAAEQLLRSKLSDDQSRGPWPR
ncbi:MAG TPA: hypothetical protein VFS05_16600 [Gemmatimonadaceae bacterium]|nr:hypothetical protein [Gemmatimonadaceae bacterium]